MDALAERIRKAAQDIREGKGDPLAELDAIADSLAPGSSGQAALGRTRVRGQR